MIKLVPTSSDLIWLDIEPGARVGLRPVTPSMMLLARDEAAQVYVEEAAADEPRPEKEIRFLASEALVRKLAHLGIAAWEGIGDAEGEPVPVTAAGVDMLLGYWPAYDVIDRLYAAPATKRSAEKNA